MFGDNGLAGKSAFFRSNGDPSCELLEPLPNSASGWGSQLRGMAVSGALARATERTAASETPEMRPVRWHVDLFRPARVRPTSVTTAVVRKGGRMGLIDAELWQEDRVVARSRATYARPTATPDGKVWQPNQTRPPTPPPSMQPREGEARLYYSRQMSWTDGAETHQNSSHKQIWHFPVVLVEGEPVTPFQLLAGVADMASLVINWGSAGVEFINVDLDLTMTRLPTSLEVGLSAVDRLDRDGVASGTAVVFDREGRFGRISVVAVANSLHRVDPADRRPDLTAFAQRARQ